MDDYLFHTNVESCRQVAEQTSYLEILNYSVRDGPDPGCALAPG